MKALSRPSALLGLCLPACLLLTGCGPSGPPRCKAVGTILLDGKPLPAPSGPMPPGELPVQVRLLADSGDASKASDPTPCIYDAATGKFTTTGLDGKGVEAGKYRVAITHFGDDAINAKFAQGKTPIVVEVKAPDVVAPEVIELNKY